MSKEKYILDPLWITRGSGRLDAELLKYVLLDANKKFRDLLQNGDISKFNEIIFHALNLNNLAIEGTVFNFNLKPIWDNPRLIEIRKDLKELYQVSDIFEVFKSANYLFVSLLIDYLEKMLDVLNLCDIYMINEMVHLEKEIFFAINHINSNGYEIWKLKFDSRINMGSRIEYIKSIEMKEENKIGQSDIDSDKRLEKFDLEQNTIFIILNNKKVMPVDAVNATYGAIAFSRGINADSPFNPVIMEELYDILITERVLPFTIKTWI